MTVAVDRSTHRSNVHTDIVETSHVSSNKSNGVIIIPSVKQETGDSLDELNYSDDSDTEHARSLTGQSSPDRDDLSSRFSQSDPSIWSSGNNASDSHPIKRVNLHRSLHRSCGEGRIPLLKLGQIKGSSGGGSSEDASGMEPAAPSGKVRVTVSTEIAS